MKRSFVQINGELVPKGEVPEREVPVDSGALWGDRSYRNLAATDGTPIDTRTKHREYMKRNNLTTIDDFKGHDQRMARERENHFKGVDSSRRADIIEAMRKTRG
jgi:hypothetical protein